MKSTFHIIILSCILIFQNCKKTDSCDNGLAIFEAHDSIPKIKIEDADSREQVIAKLQDKFGEDLCYREIEFGWQLSTKTIRTFFKLYCPIKTSRVPVPSEIRILINQEKKLLLNNETIIELDSIGNWLAKDFQSSRDTNLLKKEVAILWNSSTPVEYFDRTVMEIINGFSLKFNSISIAKFNEPFCKLNAEQTSAVIASFPYKLVFDIGVPSPPPPPPNE